MQFLHKQYSSSVRHYCTVQYGHTHFEFISCTYTLLASWISYFHSRCPFAMFLSPTTYLLQHKIELHVSNENCIVTFVFTNLHSTNLHSTKINHNFSWNTDLTIKDKAHKIRLCSIKSAIITNFNCL